MASRMSEPSGKLSAIVQLGEFSAIGNPQELAPRWGMISRPASSTSLAMACTGGGTAAPGDVRLQNVGRAQLDQDVEAVFGVLVFTTGDPGPALSLSAYSSCQLRINRICRQETIALP